MARLAEPNIALSQGVVPFVGLPIDDIKETHRDLVMRNQMAHEQTGALGEYISSINDLGNNGIKEMREEELGLIEETVSTMTKNKDAHFRVREIANTAQRIKRHKGINTAKAIEVQHQAVMEHNSESKWEEQYKNAATQLSLDSIADFKYDAESNTVTGGNYSGIKLNEIPDVTSKLNSIMALFKSSKNTEISPGEFNTASEQAKAQYGIDIAPYIAVRKDEAEYYDMAQVQQAIYSAMKADPEIRQYVQTKSMLDVYMFNRSQRHLIANGDTEGAEKSKNTYISDMMDMAYDTSVIKRAEIAKYNEQHPWSPFNKLPEDEQTDYLERKVSEYRGEIMNQFEDDKGVLNDKALINHLSQQAVMGNYANTYMGVFSGVKHSADLQLVRNAYFDYMANKSDNDALVVPYAGGTVKVDGESYVDNLTKVRETYRNAVAFINNAELKNDSNYTARQAALTKLERAFPDGTRTNAQQRQIDNANDAIKQAEIAFYRKMEDMEKAKDIARTEIANETYNQTQLSAIAPDFSNDIVHDFMRYEQYKTDGTNITREDIDDFLTEHMFSSDDVIQSEFAKLLNSKYVTPTDLKMLPDYYTGGTTIEYTPYMSLIQGIYRYRKQYAKIIDEQGLHVPYSTISVQGVPGIETFMKDLTGKIANFELPNAKILSIGSSGKVVKRKNNQTFVGQLLGGSQLEDALRGYNGGVSLDYATGSISDNGNIIVAATWRSDTRPAVSMYLELPDTRKQQKGFTNMVTKAAATSTNDITKNSFNELMNLFQVTEIASTPITDNTGKPLGDSTLGMKIGTMTKGTTASWQGYINGNVKISVAANSTGVRGMFHIDTPEGEQTIPISEQDANGNYIYPTGTPYANGAALLRDLYKYKPQLKLN